ncbi:hypothetical protein TKK_0000818 [Trichogramma kaykai]|uniref:Protein krueppel n=1 Tax=Trichogramma kaykai TaxID=54128 RepID=A0ABD2VW94_9HYME
MALSDNYFAMPMNMDRVCRICLQENTNLTPIFANDPNLSNLTDLSQKIQICGGVECNQQDGLPSHICDVCIYKATVAYEFRQLSQHSDTRLRVFYNKPAKYSATDSETQTEHLQMITASGLLVEPQLSDLQKEYFPKVEESLSHSSFHNTMVTKDYTVQTQATDTGGVTMSVEDNSFDCHLNFVDQPHLHNHQNNGELPKEVVVGVEKSDTINDSQELLTVPLIDDMESNNKGVTYFTYEIAKEVVENMENPSNSMDNHSSSLSSSEHEKEETKFVVACKSEESTPFHDFDGGCAAALEKEEEKCSKSGEEKKSKQYDTSKGTDQSAELQSEHQQSSGQPQQQQQQQQQPHKCRLCVKEFGRLENFERHVCSGLQNDHRVSELENVNATTTTSTTNSFNCEDCGQKCSTLKNLKRHQLIHGERKYSCTVCKKWFFRADTLKKHAERHGHGLLDNLADENELYQSDEDSDEMKSRKCTIGDENAQGEYKCQHCEKIMATKKGLRRHVAMHKPKPEPAVCEVCSRVCASRARLLLHLRTHKPKDKPAREYLCHICSKVYPSNSSLTYHMRTHSGVKPHVCKTCGSGFTTTTSLANHMRIHTGDRPFVCHVCSAAFAVSSAFKRHLTRHTGEANYLCKTCGKAFKRLSTLKEHTYTHSGEKPYICKTCGAAYSHSGSLFAHQKRCRAASLNGGGAQFNNNAPPADNDLPVNTQDENVQSLQINHIHVSNVQSAVRALAVIGPMF